MISMMDINIARTNRFIVHVMPPPSSGIDPRSFYDAYIEAGEMPSMTIATEDYDIDGNPPIKIPYKKTPAQTLSITIRLEEDGKTRSAFQKWMDYIIPNQNNTSYFRRYYDEIVGTVKIRQLDINGNSKFGVTLLNAYPVTVDTLQYNWSEKDEYVKQNVTIAYFDQINNDN